MMTRTKTITTKTTTTMVRPANRLDFGAGIDGGVHIGDDHDDEDEDEHDHDDEDEDEDEDEDDVHDISGHDGPSVPPGDDSAMEGDEDMADDDMMLMDAGPRSHALGLDMDQPDDDLYDASMINVSSAFGSFSLIYILG